MLFLLVGVYQYNCLLVVCVFFWFGGWFFCGIAVWFCLIFSGLEAVDFSRFWRLVIILFCYGYFTLLF